MKILLRVDASPRKEGSYSRAVASHFQDCWLKANPGGQVVVRDLAEAPVPHLDDAGIAALRGAGNENGAAAARLSDQLIAELEAADQVVISSPLYNFSTPSGLKAYLDHIVRFGRTFDANGRRYIGRLRGRNVCLITARGGQPSDGVESSDFQGPLLNAVFRFIGFERTDWIALEGTGNDDGRLHVRIARARSEVEGLLAENPPARQTDVMVWLGEFTAQDRAEITALRNAQVGAIVSGDAGAYARLCTEDVLLMLPGRDVVTGRPAMLECEAQLFKSTRFEVMRQFPLRVERAGNLAVESGRQEIVTAPESAGAEAFKARRKYLHTLRKTAEGWRFVALMSNNSL